MKMSSFDVQNGRLSELAWRFCLKNRVVGGFCGGFQTAMKFQKIVSGGRGGFGGLGGFCIISVEFNTFFWKF